MAKLRFPSEMRDEMVRVGRGLTPLLRERRGFEGLQVLTDAGAGEVDPSCVGRMGLMSSFLYGPLRPKTYEVGVRA